MESVVKLQLKMAVCWWQWFKAKYLFIMTDVKRINWLFKTCHFACQCGNRACPAVWNNEHFSSAWKLIVLTDINIKLMFSDRSDVH